MLKKSYVNYNRPEVYAIVYSNLQLVFYNSNFAGGTKLYLMIHSEKEVPHAEVL